MSPSPAHISEEHRFAVLALDYQMARDDERTFSSVQAAVASLTVVLLAALATVMSDACPLNDEKPGCKYVPAGLLAGAPAIPLAALAFVQLLGMVSALRSYYIRAVESELRKYAPSPLEELTPVAPIGPASYYGLITEVTTLRRGRAGYRILAIMIMLIALAVFSGLTLYIAIKLGGNYRNIMLVGYGTAFTVLATDVAAASIGARSTFLQVAHKFRERQNRPLLSGSSSNISTGRSLASYLLWPRPEDWIKWLFVPGAYLLTSWARGKSADWDALAITVLITEYLVYSARYQWNDIRGMMDDAAHPQTAARMRLPSTQDKGQRRFIFAATSSAAILRLGTALGLGIATGQGWWVLALIILVFSIAVFYEFLRTTESANSSESVRKRAARTLWVIVGAGYALRYLVGAHVAGVALFSELAISGSVFTFAFGIMFVLLAWTLEAASYCRADQTARSPASWYTDDRLRRKLHLMLLLQYLVDVKVRQGWDASLSMKACGNDPILRPRVAIYSPWNIAYWSACSAGAWLATNLPHATVGSRGLSWGLFNLAGSVVVSSIGRPLGRTVTSICCIVILWGVAGWDGEVFNPHGTVVSSIPWLLTTATYLFFRLQTYQSLKSFVPNLPRRVNSLARRMVRTIAGPDTWEAIR
ncbi:hypothetical protein OHB05_27515 [Streptomyces sp. NBC_00638]|uniref:hypothetical protein n=1 Tax=Streptomyces sp. NBC_00638 TaxID=2975794 RepID=UPI0022527CD4|nr:hypothetical protein [Streptomyces sp. NBC_00638]MCX5006341.1 hypothetical protein [Streptomyces sp. NBC_00638]